MTTSFLIPFSEEVYFCQKFDIKCSDLCDISEFFQDFASILSRAKIFKQTWIENRIGRIGHKLSVNIVSFDLNVDRKFDNCFHKFKIYKLLMPFVLKDSSGEENNLPRLPDRITWVKSSV